MADVHFRFRIEVNYRFLSQVASGILEKVNIEQRWRKKQTGVIDVSSKTGKKQSHLSCGILSIDLEVSTSRLDIESMF